MIHHGLPRNEFYFGEGERERNRDLKGFLSGFVTGKIYADYALWHWHNEKNSGS